MNKQESFYGHNLRESSRFVPSRMSSNSFSLDPTPVPIPPDYANKAIHDNPDVPPEAEIVENADFAIPEFSTNLLGLASSIGINALTESQNQSNLANAQQGKGPGGSNFLAMSDAQQQASHNSENRAIESAAIGVGAAFGPEGLAAGAGIAALVEGYNQLTEPGQQDVLGTNNQTTPV